MALGQRLKQARLRAGLTQGQLAQQVGMTQAAIGALETRDSRQSTKAAELARTLAVSLEWLTSGEGPMEREARPSTTVTHINSRQRTADELEFIGHMDAWDSHTPLDADEVELPLFREVELAAGAGATQVMENHGAKLRFAKSTLRRAHVSPENAACAFVKGNSMEPVMPDGTTVGVNTADTEIRDGEIYAIDHNGMLRVKFLHRKPGGGIRIVSQNATEHQPEEYTAQDVIDENIRVIGRVFWWSVLR